MADTQLFDLRKEIVAMVHRAIDSSKHYSGEEYDQNRHNWEQITTDRIIAAVMQSLPDPIDIRSKYETDAGGLFVNIGPDNTDSENDRQIDYLAAYQMDQGFNKYYFTYADYLKRLYTVPQNVVQSEHEQRESIHREGESDSPDDKEPSKVR